MLAWILEDAGLAADFLIGGVAQNFGVSARYGNSPYFVVEADEYDTAFFDKRSKFVHYRPRTLIVNNLEYDHADIFPDLAAIQRQFHHLIRTVPSSGTIICNAEANALDAVLAQGCWSSQETFGAAGDWQLAASNQDCSEFQVRGHTVNWDLIGLHNANNALAAIAAAATVGVSVDAACRALSRFKNVKRRLEIRGVVNDITVYDDFAHHPTAIAVTLDALRRRVGHEKRIIAVLEPRSNTMRLGVHNKTLLSSLKTANLVLIYQAPGWHLEDGGAALMFDQVEDIIAYLKQHAQAGDSILIMSNGGFEGIHQRVLDVL
jgi:UDP-N-acetylmuramate: L-alanyl-gamma-D-glutamyl-meso-diaminopimelate ligase